MKIRNASVLIVVFVAGSSCDRQPKSLEGQIGEASRSTEAAVVIFSPTSCSTASSMINLLDSIADLPGVAVQGVMINPPALATDRDQLLRRFGLRFPVASDVDGRWSAAIQRSGYPLPVVGVVSRGEVQAIVSGDMLMQFAQAIRTHFGIRAASAK